MRRLIKFRRIAILLLAIILLGCAAWLYWNRISPADLSAWAPADSLAYVEVNDLALLTEGVERTPAWKGLAPLLGAPQSLAPNRWLVRLARLTGIGSADALLFARSQVAVVLSGSEGTENGATLVIKPLLTIILETHTSQRRMRTAVERHLEDLAHQDFANPAFVRKQVSGFELNEWQSEDGARKIVFAFVNTTVLIANDENAVLRSIEAGTGRRAALSSQPEMDQLRRATDTPTAVLFGFVTQSGVRSLLQAYALRAEGAGGVSSDAVTKARLFSDTFGGIVRHLGWTTRFIEGAVEDRVSISLAEGVTDRLGRSMTPDRAIDLAALPFVPADSQSVSIYSFHDTSGTWNDLSAVISAHADLIGAIAARPLMRSLLSAYGVVDAETFTLGIGTRVETVRIDEASPAVLIAEVFDRPSIEKGIAERFGAHSGRETFAGADLITAPDNWTAAFYENNFLIGPGEQVRRCLQARINGESISSTRAFREAQRFVDVSLPLTVLTFTNDSRAAVSFVDAWSRQPRSAFSTNAGAIAETSKALPLALSAAVVKSGSLEWTNRSSFGIGGAITAELLAGR